MSNLSSANQHLSNDAPLSPPILLSRALSPNYTACQLGSFRLHYHPDHLPVTRIVDPRPTLTEIRLRLACHLYDRTSASLFCIHQFAPVVIAYTVPISAPTA